MASFEIAFKKTIGLEGGYIDDLNDPGGETKYGISKRSFPGIDIKNLTIDQAKSIYLHSFWHRANLDLIADQDIANEIFDSMVNIGPKVKRWLQQAYNLTNYNDGNMDITEDSIIGSKTIMAINSSSYPDRILKVLNGLQIGHYIKIVKAQPKLEKWLGGWLKRVWEI